MRSNTLLGQPFYADWLVQFGTIPDASDAAVDAFLGEPLAASQMPTGEASRSLIAIYFEHSDSFTPILRRTKFDAILQLASSSDSANAPNCLFTTWIVFATATLLMNRKTASFPASRAEAYFLSARNVISKTPGLLHGDTPQAIENIALFVQFLLLGAKLRPAWHLLGIATRMAVEFNLHKQETHDLTSDEAIDRCWLFWSIYSFERILCAVLERPVAIPDEAITVPLPSCQGNAQLLVALQLIKQRQMLSEICTTLIHRPPRNGAALDLASWRTTMLGQLQAVETAVELSSTSYRVMDPEIIVLYSSQLILLLLYPPCSQPVTDLEGLTLLANTSYTVIHRYKSLFKTGPLRYYWRTMHHLHRAGSAMIYCLKRLTLMQHNGLPLEKFIESINVCSAVLWGMTERYQPGAKYRDDFDMLAAALGVGQVDAVHAADQSATIDLGFFLDVDSLDGYTDLHSIHIIE